MRASVEQRSREPQQAHHRQVRSEYSRLSLLFCPVDSTEANHPFHQDVRFSPGTDQGASKVLRNGNTDRGKTPNKDCDLFGSLKILSFCRHVRIARGRVRIAEARCQKQDKRSKLTAAALGDLSLQALAKVYENTNDRWRALGYSKAIAALKRQPKPITTFEVRKLERCLHLFGEDRNRFCALFHCFSGFWLTESENRKPCIAEIAV